MSSLIAKKYANALLEIDGLSIEDVKDDLKAIADVINSNADVAEFLNSPLANKDAKFESVVAPLKDKLDQKVINLLSLMSEKGRLSLIPDLVEILDKEIQAKNALYSGYVETSDEIDATLVEKLEKKLSAYSNTNVKLEVKKSDIDGIKVEVSDLGLELNFSKESVKRALIEEIKKAL
jgi:F-type H+-transporting ATPase subunit delta